MAYVKQTWKNLPDESTPLSASRLNKLETQYEEAVNYTDSRFQNLDLDSLGVASKAEFDKVYGLFPNLQHLYVSPSGNDTTGDGSETKPFRTVQKTFDSIPKLIGRDYTINIADGTYAEEAVLKGVIGSAVMIKRWQGEVPSTSDTGVNIRALRFYDCTAYIFVQNVTFYAAPANSASLLFSRCVYGTSNANRFKAPMKGTGKEAIKWDGSGGGGNSNSFSNQDVCIYSLNGSRVRVDSSNSVFGTSSTTHIKAQAADVYLNGASTWATSYLTLQGGVIHPSEGSVVLSGFSYVQGNGTTLATSGITFPFPLQQITGLQLTFAGAKPTSAGTPLGVTDLPTNWGDFQSIYATGTSAMGSTVRVKGTAAMGTGFYFGFTWTVTGSA